jgi:IrrE N-terminal-like domain
VAASILGDTIRISVSPRGRVFTLPLGPRRWLRRSSPAPAVPSDASARLCSVQPGMDEVVDDYLCETACMLAEKYPAPSERLNAALSEHGLAVLGERRPKGSRLQGGLRIQGSGRAVVVIYSDEPERELTCSQRFTAAHELGHYLVERRWGLRPSADGDYWALERSCNSFAAHLLVSDEDVRSTRCPYPTRSSRLLGVCLELARQCGVSVEPACRRLVESLPDASFCFVAPPTAKSRGYPVLRWVAETASWIAAGRGTYLPPAHWLSGIAARALVTSPATTRVDWISGVDVASKHIFGGALVATARPSTS